jgi:hypothetical protein
MLKKILLSTLITASTLATAQITFDLNLAINSQGAQRNIAGTIIVDEDVIVPVEFNGLDGFIVGLLAKNDNENIMINAQFFQKTEIDEFEAVTQVFDVQTVLNETATIVVNSPEDEGTSIVLTLTPTQVE